MSKFKIPGLAQSLDTSIPSASGVCTPTNRSEKPSSSRHRHRAIVGIATILSSTNVSIMHPMVRDLYKRAILAGRDYPVSWSKMRETWKRALRDPTNCPSCYVVNHPEDSRLLISSSSPSCEKEIRRAVARGRYMVREMIGVIQLKKYRAMKQRYYDDQ
jgi:hypothetical protein